MKQENNIGHKEFDKTISDSVGYDKDEKNNSKLQEHHCLSPAPSTVPDARKIFYKYLCSRVISPKDTL